MPTIMVWFFLGAGGAAPRPPPRVMARAESAGAVVDSCLRSTGASAETVGACTAPGVARAPGALKKPPHTQQSGVDTQRRG